MRYIFILILFLLPGLTPAVEWEDRTFFNGRDGGAQTLRILSSTDTAYFSPIIEGFLADNPQLNIEYLVAGTVNVYNAFRNAPEEFDVVISSAMDLQLKLVNDGSALQLDGIESPDWSQWRRSLFGFTLEPAAIVVNKASFAGLAIPQTRQEMIEVLRENPEKFQGKVGTYDVRQSGLGYLFATQDARSSETYWRLMEVMGSLGTQLYCCSGDMIEDLATGEIAIAYNVIGNYAFARTDLADTIDIILPSDFPTTMMRTAFVAKHSAAPERAADFVRHLTSSRWRSQNSDEYSIPSLHAAASNIQQSTIALGPGLMIYLDRLKRKSFIEAWESAIIQ